MPYVKKGILLFSVIFAFLPLNAIAENYRTYSQPTPVCTATPTRTPTATATPTRTPTPFPIPSCTPQRCTSPSGQTYLACSCPPIITPTPTRTPTPSPTPTFTPTPISSCGDGAVNANRGEQCDDGNVISGDGCSALCLSEYCGDGVIQIASGEQCDDGNTTANDGCSSACAIETPPGPNNCVEYDMTQTQFSIDQGVKKQEFFINQALKQLKHLSPNARTSRYSKKTAKLAHETQLEGWRIAWSVPSTGELCDFDPTFCSFTNLNGTMVATYLDRTTKLHRIMKRVLKKVKAARGKLNSFDRWAQKKEAKQFGRNTKLANELPGVSESCVYPNFN